MPKLILDLTDKEYEYLQQSIYIQQSLSNENLNLNAANIFHNLITKISTPESEPEPTPELPAETNAKLDLISNQIKNLHRYVGHIKEHEATLTKSEIFYFRVLVSGSLRADIAEYWPDDVTLPPVKLKNLFPKLVAIEKQL